MVDIACYLRALIGSLESQFANRLLYVGLQGSYLRGEATDSSDIDVMVILDSLGIDDMEIYRNLISSLEYSDRSCGFICGREDLANWNPLEICHLLNSTKDHYGHLADFVPAYSREDVRNFAKLSLNNLYHELCHRYIHGKMENTENALPAIYKSSFFILQNLHYLRTGEFAGTKSQLADKLTGRDRDVLVRAMAYADGAAFDFSGSYQLLFEWCQESLQSV